MTLKDIICNTLMVADKILLLKSEGYREVRTPFGKIFSKGLEKVEYDETNDTWTFPDGEFYLENLQYKKEPTECTTKVSLKTTLENN